MPDKPVISAGDIARKLRLPGWLRWILDLLRGTKIHAGPVDVQLDERPGTTTPPGLEMPHRPDPPQVGPR